MFSIANLLDSAKAKAVIESDYRLAKIIGISHSAMTHYRMGRSLPNEKVIEQLCALSGDDPGVIAAEIQAARSKSPEAVNMWLMIAQRLSSDRRQTVRAVSTAILSVLFSLVLIASPSGSARAAGVDHIKAASVNLLYIV